MVDICLTAISCKDKDSGSIETFFVRNTCFNNETYSDIEKNAIGKINKKTKEDHSSFIDTNVSKKTAKPKENKYFHAKFIGCIYSEKQMARVLVTSANFTGANLGCDNLESVVCHEMTEKNFEERFIKPLRLICE